VNLERRFDIDPASNDRDRVREAILRLAVVGPEGAVGLVVHTSWFLPETLSRMSASTGYSAEGAAGLLEPWSQLVVHHRRPAGGATHRSDCPYHGDCYLAVLSGDSQDGLFETLLRGGTERVWTRLETLYQKLLEA